MQRARTPDGRFQSAAPYQHARGADGRFIAQRALQVADHPTYDASHAEIAEIPLTVSKGSWLKPMAGMAGMAGTTAMLAALGNIPTSLAYDVSGAITATGTINALPHSIFAMAANSLPIGEPTDISNGTTSADGTRNAFSLAMLPAATTSHLTCPPVPGLPIERCGADVPEMSVSQFVDMGMRCLQTQQSGDNCNICFCAMFHVNRALQKLVLALDQILQRSRYAREFFGAQMLSARSLIEYVTDVNPLSEIGNLDEFGGWQEAMARITETLKHYGRNFDLLGVAKQLLQDNPNLFMDLRGVIGVSLFAVVWFLKWWLWSKGDDERADVNVEARVEEVEEAEQEEELPTDDSPGIYAENTTITLVHKRIVGRTRVLQYRFHVENQHPKCDNWASIPLLTELFGSAEALRRAIEKYELMSAQWDPRSMPSVKTVTKQQMDKLRRGQVWF